jgi:Na+/H+-translocating membrane pyrophosphatase
MWETMSGDVGGMKADSLESWIGSIVAAIFLGFIAFRATPFMMESVLLPMILATAGTIASIIAIFIIKAVVSNTRSMPL